MIKTPGGWTVELVSKMATYIGQIYKKGILVWESISGCFTKGYWVNNKGWTNNKGWKN